MMPLDLYVFPAHAGMNRIDFVAYMALACVPRTRGDEPALPADDQAVIKCSPHTRG